MNKKSIKRMVGIATLSAIVVVLQLIANYIPGPGGVSFTLALIPLVIGSIIYGLTGGAILGVIMGGIILTAPSTSSFLNVNPIVTVILCLVKTGAAGAVSGLVFKLLKKYNLYAAVIVSSIIAPIINTGLFSIGCMLFYMETLTEWAGGSDAISYLFLTMIGVNFIVEFAINSILSPTVMYIIKIISKNFNIGSDLVIEEKSGVDDTTNWYW